MARVNVHVLVQMVLWSPRLHKEIHFNFREILIGKFSALYYQRPRNGRNERPSGFGSDYLQRLDAGLLEQDCECLTTSHHQSFVNA